MVLEGKNCRGAGGRGHSGYAVTEKNTGHRGRNVAQCEQPLEEAGSFASIRCRKAFGQIERNHHSNQSAADPLQQPAQKQRPIAVRQCNHWNTNDERCAAQDHQRLAAQPVDKNPRKQRGDYAPQQDSSYDDGKLCGGKSRGSFQVG